MHYGHHHLCKRQNVLVEKEHINDCDLIKSDEGFARSLFNHLFEDTSLYDLSSEDLDKLKHHFRQLETRLSKLEESKDFLKVFVEAQ